jgi:predicted MPP superfamily phosphohydrolase
VVAVLGNHDHWTAPEAVQAALTKAGITVVENQAVRRGEFTIIGIGDRFSGHDDLPSALATARKLGGVPVILTHSPDLVPDLPGNQLLVLAAHTHCGQVVLPWVGPLIMHAPSDHWRQLYNPRYRCGIVRDGRRTTIVTAGVGSGTLPLRLGAMPDWWLLSVEP